MKLLYGHDRAVCDLVAKVIWNDHRKFDENSVAVGVLDTSGNLIGGFVWTNWQPEAGTIEISAASVSRRWLTRRLLWQVFAYPFDEIGCQCVYAHTRADNAPVSRLLESIGFVSIDVPRLHGRNADGVLWWLTEENWRAGIYGEL